MILSIDLDGVVVDLIEVVLPYLSHKVGFPVSRQNFTSYSIGRSIGKGPDWEQQFWEEVYKDGIHLLAPPVSGAIEGLSRLVEERVTFVTSRPLILKDDTQRWLEQHGLERYEVIYEGIVARNSSTRVFDLVIDDNPGIVESAIVRGSKACVFDQPWNQRVLETTSLYRARGWQELIQIIDRLKVDHLPSAQ